MIEIERKFLVKTNAYKDEAFSKNRIVQGFLNSNAKRTVRIRIKGDKGFLTIKGLSNSSGTSRFEWEKEIPLPEAEQLLPLCEKGIINKTRYYVTVGEHTFEVDDFHDENQGLVVAEIELSKEKDAFQKPEWLGKEVTGEVRYYNSQLAKNPFKEW